MTVFYRKYRPQKFADLVGQNHIRETLLAQLESGKIAHGYLFAGPRGSGKTSTARIFAKAVNCLVYNKKPETRNQKQETKFGEPCDKCLSCTAITNGSALDLVEIDAASNRGIDEIRDLREKIKLSPISSRFKVYIIDEAHMLTTEAFNALLKTLEEPPRHVIFILCTTAVNKLPLTIISRLARFNFIRAGDEEIIKLIGKIAKSEGIKIEDEAQRAIAKAADGAYRDAVSILDQLSATGRKVTVGDVSQIAYILTTNILFDFVQFLINRDTREAVLILEKLEQERADFSLFARDVVLLFEKVMLIKIGVGEVAEDVTRLAGGVSYGDLQNLMRLFVVAEGEIKTYPLAKIPLILAVCKYCGEPQINQSVGELKNQEISESAVSASVTGNRQAKKKRETGNKGMVKSLEQIEGKWDQFLEKVRPVNAHILALLRSTRPTALDGATLILEVFYQFHKDKLEEPKVRSQLENFLAEVFGQKIMLRLILAQRTTPLPKIVEASDVIDVAGEDLTALAQEIFSK